MADNTTLNPGSGGDVIASDDIAGVKYQRVKVSVGADGAAADNAATAPLHVRLSDGSASVDTLPVSNAGTFATQINGAALTALQLIDNIVLAEDAAHQTGDAGVQALAVRNDSDASLAGTTGDYTPLQVDANGYLKVNIKAGAAAGGTSATDDSVFTIAGGSGTPIMGVVSSDAADSGDVAVVGMTATRSLKTVVTNSSGTIIDPQTDDAAFTAASGLISVIGAFATSDSVDSGDAGAIGMTTGRAMYVAEQGAHVVTDDAAFTAASGKGIPMMGFATSDSVDSGDIGAVAMTTARALHAAVQSVAAGANLIGDVGISGARTSGGTTIFRSIDLDESEEEIKASAGQVYWIHCMNLSASVVYLKLYNATAANVTVGTTTPVLTFPIPTQGTTSGAGFTLCIPNGIAFSTAITAACTTGVADNDTGAPAANVCVLNLGYA